MMNFKKMRELHQRILKTKIESLNKSLENHELNDKEIRAELRLFRDDLNCFLESVAAEDLAILIDEDKQKRGA